MKAAAISTGPDTHLDHLGVLAGLLEIPLIITDKKSYELAKVFYPSLDCHLMEPAELSLDFLSAEFNVIFGTGKYWCMELMPLFQLLFGKRMRHVFCPHGNSDKGSTLAPGSHPPQDISLIYGAQMRDLLKRTGALAVTQQTVTTGNYRYPFYRKHRSFYDRLAYERIFSRFSKEKKTILYAPTWSNEENPTAFFEACSILIEQLAPFYNLLIKLHPFLEQHEPAQLSYLQERYRNYDSAAFVTDFPAVYPLLAKSDLYLGDFSSVGYDFLAFDRPLYFFNPRQNEIKRDAKPLLYRCGIEIPLNEETNLKRFIEETLNENARSSVRSEIYEYAFGKEREVGEIKMEIETALSQSLSSVN